MKRFLNRARMIVCLTLLINTGVQYASAEHQSASNEIIEGIWFGTMEMPNSPEQRYVVEISPLADGTLRATLINLDQGGVGIPAGEFTFEAGAVRLELRSYGVVYEGTMQENGSTIEGRLRYSQAGQSFVLVLERVDEVPGFARPQTPKKPYPYHEEEVVYQNEEAGIALAGTLTRPRSKGLFPAVLLISGSGAQDRDET